MKIKKAVIPIAGRGTRFLPATKEIPKEMIPILTRPMIHYVVEEVVASGIEEIIFVTATGKESIENYFDQNKAYEEFLKSKNKIKELELIERIASMTNIVTVRQKEQLGLGHAIRCAESITQDENFAVLVGDDLILSSTPCIKQLMDISQMQNNSSVIGVMEIPPGDSDKYGMVAGEFLESDPKTLKMQEMVEKPSPEDSPSNLATPGRYIFTPKIYQCLHEIPKGAGGEYQLTDGINMLCSDEEVYAHIFAGDRFDTGNIEGYFNATLEFALRDPQLKEMATRIIKEKAKKV